jgi:hypothetical protein
MSHRKTFACVLLVALVASPLTAPRSFAAGDDSSSSTSGQTVRYSAPPHSASQVRVNGVAGRGGHVKLPDLFVLTPEHVGLTVQEQPTIFWYLSASTDTKLKVTITKDGEDEPLLETQLPATKGIQRLSLAEKNVKLEPDVQYQVNFALIPDEKNRSEDLCASGMIKRVKPPQSLVAKLVARADPLDRAIAYAKGGIWYDALSVISDEIDRKDAQAAQAAAMRRHRAELMEQVSLPDVANYDLAADDK